MSGSIKKSIAVSTALLLFLFVIIGFGASYIAIRHIDSRYQDASVQAALDFAELTIDADAAKECFSTRNRTEDYFTVQNKISEYQKNNSSIISRISLVSFSNSSGYFIYDSSGAELGSKLDYNDQTSASKAELINGRSSLEYKEKGYITAMRPVRTVDDTLCGYIIVKIKRPYGSRHFMFIGGVVAGILIISVAFVFIISAMLNRRIFKPIKQITDSAVYLSGDDSASEGKDASVMFDTKRKDEIGRLSSALQKIFFDMNTGAKHLSQALYDANHDGMTQHLNKRCYHSMEETFRSSEQLCVVYFDVNNLKLMNDTNGHESGDFVIKRAADYIRGFLGQGDYCFRMGGDEFLIVMTERSFRDLDSMMEKLSKDSPYILSRESDSIKCSLSYGCAFAKGEFSYDELLAEAEENMYRNKTELKKLLQMPDR
ncbi:MAG: sensor domain-containing diguanylate cyclase [Ruminococcus sp.]|nr:sensor domain-containing diguanylate cyclase [Ruminococcus sp.]